MSIFWFLIGTILVVPQAETSHFYGGSISWRPRNNILSGTSTALLFHQRYTWRGSTAICNDTTIANAGLLTSSSMILCYTGSCNNSSWVNVSTNVFCTDYSIQSNFSTGEIYSNLSISRGNSFSVGFVSGTWLPNLVIGGGLGWSIISQVNTYARQDGFINTSPTVSSLPIVYKQANVQQMHQVQIADADGGDILRCRWATPNVNNTNQYDECGGICQGIPGAILSPNNCSLTFNLNQSSIYYAVALQIEDYYSSNSTTPMSSVPLQFLIYSYTAPSGCSTPPSISMSRQNGDCINVPIGSSVIEWIVGRVYCAGFSINEFVTVSPLGMLKTGIRYNGFNMYQMNISWTPTSTQLGPQVFCAAAVDNNGTQSDQWCITFLVGFDSTDLIRPSLNAFTAAPIGTVFANQSIFSIQSNSIIQRPTRSGTFIRFKNIVSNATIYSLDCALSSELTYTQTSLFISLQSPPWVPGETYYVTFDSGAISDSDSCGPKSFAVTNSTFWRFDVFNTSLPSTPAATTLFTNFGTTTTANPTSQNPTDTSMTSMPTSQTTYGSQYFCPTNESLLTISLSSSSHSAWNPPTSCSLSACGNSTSNNSSCRTLATPCFAYVANTNVTYCAPGALCSLLQPCNNITRQCISSAFVCIINSCCVPQAVCLPLAWVTLCT